MFEHLMWNSRVWVWYPYFIGYLKIWTLIIRGVLNWWSNRPFYTNPLEEPSWGHSGKEDGSDEDMDADGVPNDEDESSEEEEDGFV
jgi:hypothetical protein